MKSQELPCPKAFRILKKAHRPSCPNEGFRSQLKLFEAMGFRLDLDHPEYRLHKLQHIVDANMATLGEIPLAPAPIRGVTEYSTLLQCRKCRFRVAVDRNVLGHEPGAGQVSPPRLIFQRSSRMRILTSCHRWRFAGGDEILLRLRLAPAAPRCLWSPCHGWRLWWRKGFCRANCVVLNVPVGLATSTGPDYSARVDAG